MGMKIAGKSRKDFGSPYSRVVALGVAPVDLTEASLTPATVGGVSPTVGSQATGARHGATGALLFVVGAGLFHWRDAAGIQNVVTVRANTELPLPFCLTEVNNAATTATGQLVAYWDD